MAFCTNCGTPVQGPFCTSCGKPVGDGGQSAHAPAPPASMPPPSSAPINIPVSPASPVMQAAPQKKKRGPLFWILTGCLGLIVIGVIVFAAAGLFIRSKMKDAGIDLALMQKNPALAAAKMMTAMNPDLEVLGVDEARGIISVRNKKTGESLTVNLEDAKKGKITFMNEKNEKLELNAGEAKLPPWLPSYANAENAGNFSLTGDKGQAGTYSFKTSDSVEDVASFYEEVLKKENLQVTKTPQPKGAVVIAKDEGEKRYVQITISEGESGTEVFFSFKGEQ